MRPLLQTFACCLALVLTGCAGYHVGPVGAVASGERSIQVVPFDNQTLEPRLTDAVTTELRRSVQDDGTYRLATHDDGDIILTGIITKYQRAEITLNPTDLQTAQNYRVTLTAQVTARSRSSGQVLLERPVSGSTLVWVGNDLASSERQALPLLAADLAKNVVEQLAEGSW